MPLAGGYGVVDAGHHVVGTSGDCQPAAGAGTDVEGDAALLHIGALLVEGMLGLIAPVEGYGVFGQLRNEFGVAVDDVGPEHHCLAARFHKLMYFEEKFHIHRRDALFLREGAAAAGEVVHIHHFVATDVEILRLEVGQQFIVESGEERDGSGIRGAQCHWFFGDGVPVGTHTGFGRFGEVVVFGMYEPAFEMAEGVLVGDEVNALFCTVGGKFADFLGGEGTPFLPHDAVVLVGEGLLGVELELVIAKLGEQIHHVFHGGEGGHLAAADVHLIAEVRSRGVCRR